MVNILKAEFKKLRSAVFIYILIALAIILPLINTGFLALIAKLLETSEVSDFLTIINTPYAYAASFSPLNNIGLLLFITVVVFAANDFTQNTIRNKIIAGYEKPTIFLASLSFNLIIMLTLMFLYSSTTYVATAAFSGFKASEFWIIFKFGVIAYSSLVVVYTLLTLLTYHFKNIIAPLLITLGILFGLLMIYSLLLNVPTTLMDFTFLEHVFPVIRLINPRFIVNNEVLTLTVDTSLWWVDLLSNLGHLTWLTLLGIHVSRTTDYK